MTDAQLLERNEEWRPVSGYDGLYEVSSLGRVRATGPRPKTSRHQIDSARIAMKLRQDKDGYSRVSLTRDHKKRGWFVHRLVLTAFCPSQESPRNIDHINGDRADNRVVNLRGATSRQNNYNRAGLSRCGVKGVELNKGRFLANITILGKKVYLGSFSTPEDAGKAYDRAAASVAGEYATQRHQCGTKGES